MSNALINIVCIRRKVEIELPCGARLEKESYISSLLRCINHITRCIIFHTAAVGGRRRHSRAAAVLWLSAGTHVWLVLGARTHDFWIGLLIYDG
jgi:hypothetical protein